MKKFEYKVIDIEDFQIKYKNALNKYGEDGWELVNVQPLYGSSRLYYFKREIIDNKKEGI
jgi:hypothetical protein